MSFTGTTERKQDREAYLYELYGDVEREAHTKDGILTAESGSSGFYILWSEGTSIEGGVLVLGRGFFGNCKTD